MPKQITFKIVERCALYGGHIINVYEPIIEDAMIRFELLHPRASYDMLGLIPEFLDEKDPRPAKEQLDTNYRHGGGWNSFKGFKLNEDNTISYPGDPPYEPIGQAKLRNETIIVYEHAWVAIVQADRTYDIARMD